MAFSTDFWRAKKVLVTGHTGFKGTWLSLLLKELGAEVAGISNDIPTEPSLFELIDLDDLLINHQIDIRNLEQLKNVIEEFKPDIVFHLAAQSLVRPSYNAPVDTFSTNIMGTVNLLESIRLNKQTKVCINVTSDKCYKNNEWHWGYREIDSLGGHDPYSSSKACSEIVSEAYRKSFFNCPESVALATARAGNVIGGGDWAQDRLIPDIFKGWLKNETISIRNPSAIRPWQHVLEAIHGYLILAEKLFAQPNKYNEAWNFGPYDFDAKPVEWIATKLWEKLPGIEFKFGKKDELHEAAYLKLDCSKAHTKLGWQPILNLESALAFTIEWYKAYRQKKNLRTVTVQQIQNYLELTKQ